MWFLGVTLRLVRRPRLTLAVAGVVLAAGLLLSWARLEISTDQNRLFSARAPFFREYLKFVEEFPENEAVYAVVEPRDAAPGAVPRTERWTSLADAIAERVRGLGDLVASVDARVPLDRLGPQGILFERPERVRRIAADAARSLPLVRLWAEAPDALSGLLGPTPLERFLAGVALREPDAEAAAFVAALAGSWNATLEAPADQPAAAVRLPDLAALGGEADPSQYGYYFVPDESDPSRRILLVRIYPRRDYTSLTAISNQVDAIRAAAVEAAAAYPEFRVGITGRPALEADEMRTTDRDTTRAEIAALTTVFMALVFILKSVRLAIAAEAALLVGIGWTLGFATAAVGELNLLSIVFLIALIGIGMDYIVQFLARYRAEFGRLNSPRELWATVFGQVAAPVTTACLGAAGAFFVALLSDFKGAGDLGLIAGTGLVLCLLSAYTVLPALLTVFPMRPVAAGPAPDVGGTSWPAPKPWRLAGPALWLALVAASLPLVARVRFDPGLINLQAPNLESVSLVRKLETWSAVVLSPDLETLRRVRSAVEGGSTVAGTESILDAFDNHRWLTGEGRLPEIEWTDPAPVTPARLGEVSRRARAAAERFAGAAGGEDAGAMRAASAELMTFSRRLSDATGEDAERQAQRLSAWQTGFVGLLREQLANLSPPPPDIDGLPPELRGHYVSPSGLYALYISPRGDLWQRDDLARFVEEVESLAQRAPGAPPVTGIAPNIHHSTRAIQRSFHVTTGLALGLIFVLVLLDMRRIGDTLLAVSVLGLGLPVLAAIMAVAGTPWNFANFFGLPILIGAGHEYGVFLVHRYREARDGRDPARGWRRWDASDNALLLCAVITICAFGFFWLLAHHRGLKSLGLVMTLGTACIYLAGLLALRPTLRWMLARRRGAPDRPCPGPGPATAPGDRGR